MGGVRCVGAFYNSLGKCIVRLHHGDGAGNMRKGHGAPLPDSSGKPMAAGVYSRIDRACVRVPT